MTARAIRAVLRHPAAMAVKRRVQDGIWTLKGRRLANPALPIPVRSLVFVCLGNICRSPFAEHLARQQLAAAGVASVRVSSAGISASQDIGVPQAGREMARRHFDLALELHRPQRLSRTVVDGHDLLVVMEAGQFFRLREEYPHAANRIVLLSLFDPTPERTFERYHIDDPYGHPAQDFLRCYRRIDRAVAQLLGAVTR